MRLDEHFAGDDLDTDVWLPYHLPQWSSRAAPAATYEVADGQLRLSIPPDQALWYEGVYAVDWRPDSLVFTVDGEVVRHIGQSPAYPVQLMPGVSDFPDAGSGPGDSPVPELVVSHVIGHPLD